MQGKIVFIKKYGNKWGLKIDGDDTLHYSFDKGLEQIQRGDSIVYKFETAISEKTGKQYENLVLTGEVPERDVSLPSPAPQPQQPTNRDASIVAQNLINRATERYIAERDTSALTTPEEADSEIKRHCEFYVNLYKETKESL